MQRYSEFRPTVVDRAGLGLEDRQDWLVAPVSQTRDSEYLEVSNFRVVLKDLEEKDGGEDVEVHRFGHWGPGWFEIILVRPGTEAAKCAEEWEAALSDYPVACDEDLSELEYEYAQEYWANWRNDRERLEWIRKNREIFYFQNWRELLECVRGKAYHGEASELVRDW